MRAYGDCGVGHVNPLAREWDRQGSSASYLQETGERRDHLPAVADNHGNSAAVDTRKPA